MNAIEFPTQYSESVRKGTKQTFMEPSMTEPDNAMSIPEIIARFTRGQGIQVQQHPWTSGSASDIDGSPVQDDNLDDFLGVQKPADSPAASLAPAAPAVAPAAAPAAALAAAPEAPAAEPAGA